jgi:Ala-tRNA(Pro) deacylase
MEIANEDILFNFLKAQNIVYRLFKHQPVFTIHDKPIITEVDGAVASNATIPRPHFKTLFLKDKNGAFFLVSVIEDKRVDLNVLSKTLGCGRFSFGKAEELLELLRLTPGSVTPFGLLFDRENKITFVLDEDTLNYPYVSFHPLRNDMTVVMTTEDFTVCMEKLGHKPLIAKITTKEG